jgi:hypothetical protein
MPAPSDAGKAAAGGATFPPWKGRPLCQDPGGDYGTTQYFAKAHPSLRQLSVLKALGSQAVVGSICPASLDDPQSRRYGYRPAVGALAEAVQAALTVR